MTTVRPIARTPDGVMNLVEDIALGRGSDGTAAMRALAWDGHTDESFTDAWDEYRKTIKAREALALGHRNWRDYYEPGECVGQANAIGLKAEETIAAYRHLMTGAS